MTFDYIDGACLHSYINSGMIRFDELLLQYIFKQIVNQIKICHDNGIANRDLKCENVMIDQ